MSKIASALGFKKYGFGLRVKKESTGEEFYIHSDITGEAYIVHEEGWDSETNEAGKILEAEIVYHEV